MVEADQNNSNKAAQLPPELIGLHKALQQFFPNISLPGPLVWGWTYVVLPRPLTDSIKREWGILELDAAMDNQDLVPFVFSKKTGGLIQLLRWREHQRGYHRDIIISGVVKASIGDEYWRYRDRAVVLLRTQFDTWREWRAQNRSAASVSKAPAAAEQVGKKQTEVGIAATAVPKVTPASVSESKQASPASPVIAATAEPQRSTTKPGQLKRGPKPYDTWPLFRIICIRQLDNDDVRAHTDVNIEDLAKKLMDWGEEHVGSEETPGNTKMREEVTKWVSEWKHMRELEDEARRKSQTQSK